MDLLINRMENPGSRNCTLLPPSLSRNICGRRRASSGDKDVVKEPMLKAQPQPQPEQQSTSTAHFPTSSSRLPVIAVNDNPVLLRPSTEVNLGLLLQKEKEEEEETQPGGHDKKHLRVTRNRLLRTRHRLLEMSSLPVLGSTKTGKFSECLFEDDVDNRVYRHSRSYSGASSLDDPFRISPKNDCKSSRAGRLALTRNSGGRRLRSKVAMRGWLSTRYRDPLLHSEDHRQAPLITKGKDWWTSFYSPRRRCQTRLMRWRSL